MLQGEVDIIKGLGTDSERLIAVRGEASFIGEMSLFSPNGLRTASVRARTPCRLLRMTRSGFDALLHRYPALAYEMVRISSNRLGESENTMVRDLREKNVQLQQAYDELKATQAQLIEQEKLEAELSIARRIQRNILPQQAPHHSGLDFGMLLEPASSVGGDFYDLGKMVETGTRFGISIPAFLMNFGMHMMGSVKRILPRDRIGEKELSKLKK